MNDYPGYLTYYTLRVFHKLLKSPDKGCCGTEIKEDIPMDCGTIYPMLQRLEFIGWTTSRYENSPKNAYYPRRKYHKLTNEGRKQVIEILKELQV
jgi:DNA-binding PadR family transcriptional regulator